MRHEAIRNLYSNVVTIYNTADAFDFQGNPVIIDEAAVSAEITRLQPIKAAEQAERNRKVAYTVESDPLFFKYQAGETTQAEWQTKRNEIKARYPK